MADGLFALEQSLKRPVASRKTRQGRRTRSHPPTNMAMPSRDELQQQIEVVQGKRLGLPSNSLRSLEDRLLHQPLGLRTAVTRSPDSDNAQRQIQRLDHGQAPVKPAVKPEPVPSYPSANKPEWADNAGVKSSCPMAYAPELSAPDTGRFLVEPFSEPLTPESLLQLAPAVSAPTTQPAAEPNAQTPVQRQTTPTPADLKPQTGSTSPLLEDDDSWLKLAGEQTPQKISDASRNSLDSSTALAADEFQRDLAAILGKAPAAAGQPQQTPQASRNLPADGGVDSTETEPTATHPTHDVFDRMGLGMQYANSFDLGVAKLQDRFDRFDRELDLAQTKTAARLAPSHTPYIDPYGNSMRLDEIDLVAELAEIGENYPVPQYTQARSDTGKKPDYSSDAVQPTDELKPKKPVSTAREEYKAKKEQAAKPPSPSAPQNQRSTTGKDETPLPQDVVENGQQNPNRIEQTTGDDDE